ncbi:UNVERIFIED_CONTAM: egr1 [Trichonephila clavipes]
MEKLNLAKDSVTCAREMCDLRFKHKFNLKRHYSVHTTEKLYECEVCGKRFKRKDDLKQHYITHSTEKPFVSKICLKEYKCYNIMCPLISKNNNFFENLMSV